jgi:hypothetical protein
MTSYPTEIDTEAARTMLDAFASVGAESFDITWTTRRGVKVQFQGQQPLEKLRATIPARLEGATRLGDNLIVRPLSPGTMFIQLDDLRWEGLEQIKPAAFLGIETSPGNYQAWVAMPAGEADQDFARRFRKEAGADDTASGATRIAGSLNFKDKYAPDFPRVEIVHSSPGLMTGKDQLKGLGLVAKLEKTTPVYPVLAKDSGTRKWPSYERCVEGAPEYSAKTGPDIFRVDFTWCMTAISWVTPSRRPPSV